MASEPGSTDPGGEPLAARAAAGVRPPAADAVRIESGAALRAAAERWLQAPAVALDTEFVRERTFFPRLGLIQIHDGEATYLLDPLAVRDLGPLADLFRAAGTLKVLHSASEDVEVFYHALGSVPAPLFDTQVAAGLAGLGTSLSYQRLVAALLALELQKGETRTDWLARPLSAAQLAYAAEDVAYLLPLYGRLDRELAALGRLQWALEDSAALLDTSRLEADGAAAYRRVRGSGRLSRRQLGVLRALAAWRDGEARRRDLPRGFVLRDEALLELAVRQPATVEELRGVSGLEAPQAARDGAGWLELIRAALALADDELPPEPWRPPGAAAVRELEQRLRLVVRERAAALGLPPELLAPRRALDAVLRSALSDPEPRLPRDLGTGWRRAVVGEALLSAAGAPG
ncbi:MAG TPA: ribonuclease D [Thermoanaerobaculia bacterium]|nr:ribonuclease D [Thermoanaerobaculia bacterium]